MAKLTDHGSDRLKERVGLGKSAQARMAKRALKEGLSPTEFSGKARRYLDKIVLNEDHIGRKTVRVYGEFVFVFGSGHVLITVWNLPNEFRAAANKLKSRVRRDGPAIRLVDEELAAEHEPPEEVPPAHELPLFNRDAVAITIGGAFAIIVLATIYFLR